MNAHQYLSDEDFAEYFLANNYVSAEDGVLDIEPRVEAWLARSDMGHRSAFSIAVQVMKLARPEPAPPRVLSPEQVAWEQDQMAGYGDPRPLTAEDIAGLDMRQFEELRSQLGIGQSKNSHGILGPIGH